MALVMTKFLVALQVLCLVFGHPENSEDTECSDHICGMYCKFGFERDEKGCEICKCKEELCNGEVCPEGKECRLMETNCQNSTSLDGTASLPMCELEEKCMPECSGKLCKMYCHLGFERDENGCEICKCKQELCNGQVCPDGTECRLMEINCQNPTSMHHSDSHPNCQLVEKCMPECEVPMCKVNCKNGNEKDEYGCDTCQCLQELCNGQVCPEGTQCQLVEVNCPKKKQVEPCDCSVVASEPVCELEDRCTPVPSCPDYACEEPCDSGYAKDEHGCETCKCLADDNSHEESRNNLSKKKVPCSDCEIIVPDQTVPYVNLDDLDERMTGSVPCSDCEIIVTAQTLPYVNLDDLDDRMTDSVPSCPDYACEEPCDSGYAKDEHGCETCKCLADDNAHEESRNNLSKKNVPCSDCEIIVPDQTVPYVNLDDLDDRMTDSVPCSDCEIIVTAQTLAYVNLDDLDARMTDSVPSCPDYACEEACDSGYAKDEQGCETCKCLADDNSHKESRNNLSEKKVPCSDCEIIVPDQTVPYVNLDDLDDRMTAEPATY